MSAAVRSRGRARLRSVAAALLLVGTLLPACSEVDPGPSSGYEPARLDEPDEAGFKRVTLSREAAERTGLRIAKVRRSGEHLVVPYDALIYDGGGQSHVYTSPEPLTFLRAEVTVDRVERDRVLLTRGPAAGSAVVTIGSTEVYGAELGIAGGH
jgi:multidrug efflux pump subunit AcrA (membrane-fusion protein)